MANERKINAIEIDHLYDFLDGLQASGFKVDVRQYMALSDLLMALIARGNSLNELPLKTLIAPLICTTPTEQQDFYQLFDRWYTSTKQIRPGREIVDSLQPPQKRTWKLPTISRKAIIWIYLIITVISFVGVLFSNSNLVTPGAQFNLIYLLYGIIVILLLILIGWGWWIYYQDNQYITRELASQEPVYTSVPVKAHMQEIMPAAQLKSIVSALRRRIQVPSSEVDVNQTIETALNRNNWVEIIYNQRQVMPEYLVLIDRKSRIDQQARFIQEVLTRLAADGVWLHQYEFSGDPRICFPIDRKESPLKLKNLQIRHPDVRLLIFTGITELLNPLTGFLQNWPESLSYWKNRTILTPDKINKALLEELQSLDFSVLPMTFDGLASLVHAFENDIIPFLKTSNSNLPSQLIERPMRWVGREAPPEADIKTVVHDLKEYLGENGFYWLCATAVYPELRWELTLHLGSKLKDSLGQPLTNPDTLLSIARLPWFRFGYMPDWIRVALIQEFEPEQEFQARAILNELLATAFKTDVFDSVFIRYAKNSFGMANSYQRFVKVLLKNSRPDSVNKDVIFAKFILKKTHKNLAVLLPKLSQEPSKDRNRQNTLHESIKIPAPRGKDARGQSPKRQLPLPKVLPFQKSESNLENSDTTILSKDPFPKIPPFIMPPTKPLRKKAVDVRGTLSIITMLVSLAALTLSMGGAAKFILDVFNDGLASSIDSLLVQIVVLGIAFFFGWVVGLVSIQRFGNLIYSIIITFYAWACLFAVSGLYLKIIQKLYVQEYDSLHYWAYFLMLLGGLFILICLHLMVEDHDLRPFAIPLLIISVIHLFAITIRYVFVANPNGWMLFGDFSIFGVMSSTSILMFAHIGILSPLRDWVNGLFIKKDYSNHNNHHGDDEEDE